MIAAAIIFVVGVIDDFRDVSAPAKLAGMVLAGSVLSVAGVTILFFRIPFADLVVCPGLVRPCSRSRGGHGQR